VSKDNLIWAKNFAEKNNLILHTHISETKKEVKQCLNKYGLRPVEFLDSIYFLNTNIILAHAVWLNSKEIEILGKHQCSTVFCPSSNMKLSVGAVSPNTELEKAGANITLGTDSSSSNNNLDLFEEMKIGALLQKHHCANPTTIKAKDVIKWPTLNASQALQINSGKIKQGGLADLILIDLNQAELVPGHNFISDIVYSANGSCVSDVICNGKILMRDRKVEGENEIIQQAKIRAKNLVKS
jgi:5-methylthioadenosine/S-adenosylhomocysteine deaminase